MKFAEVRMSGKTSKGEEIRVSLSSGGRQLKQGAFIGQNKHSKPCAMTFRPPTLVETTVSSGMIE
jgi:hypothetical protein